MRLKECAQGLAGVATLLAMPALALGASVPSVYQGNKGDFLVGNKGRTIERFTIVCKTDKTGINSESIYNIKTVSVSRTGSFSMRGRVAYVKTTPKSSKLTKLTVKLSGKIVSKKRVTGKLTGGPDHCKSVSFTLAYNPHPGG